MQNQQPATSNQKRPRLYLIDGSGFIFRAYHAMAHSGSRLTSPDGVPIGAVHTYVNMILKLIADHKGDYMAVIFDAARKTFRNRIYEGYKANRPPAPDDLIPQFPIVREATEALGLPAIELADYEADDIIATYAHEARRQGIDVVIISSDKDLMQLIGDGVSMYDAMKQKSIGEAEVREKFGVGPDKVRHVLALMGDSSDNVPGVPGIGPKTAAELIGQYGDIETLLSRAGEIKQNKRRETIQQNTEQARISYELIGLKHDVPLPAPLDALAVRELNAEEAIAFCQKYGLKTALSRLQSKFDVKPVIPSAVEGSVQKQDPSTPLRSAQDDITKHYTIVRDEKTLIQWIEKATRKGSVSFDTETTSINALRAELVGLSLCIEPGSACYVPLAHVVQSTAPAQSNLFGDAEGGVVTKTLAPNQIPLAKAIALIKPLLEDASVLKIGHNIKYDMHVMQNYGVSVAPIEDTMLLSYVLHAGEHGAGMDELAERYLNYKTITFDEVTGTGKNRLRFDEVEIEKAGEYAAEDADITLRLHAFFKPQLFAQHMLSLYETIERPLISVLLRMERAGIKVDVAQLGAMSKDFAARMIDYEREIHQLAGMEFNVGSPKQLGEVLFDKLQLGGGKKSSKSGAYSTDSGVLEDLAEEGHPIAAKVIEWRQLAKLKSTYTDALAGEINPKTGRVHTSFAQAIASTGRLSSTDPNLQNIPIRTEEGRKIRCAFVAEPGCVLLSADYSQIELRLLAHMADIATLKEAFRNGDDIHAITASQMFGVPVKEVNADLRRSAKTINFGIIYGISAHGLATRLGIGRQEAGAYIEQYFRQYPGIRDYMEASKEFAREHGYVTTLYGRRCHLPGINGKGPMRAFSERAAINAPLQGTAADIIKRAMIAIDRKIMGGARMLLQVHDELVFEVAEDRAQSLTPFVKQAMEHAAELSVPLTVETGVGRHWGEAH